MTKQKYHKPTQAADAANVLTLQNQAITKIRNNKNASRRDQLKTMRDLELQLLQMIQFAGDVEDTREITQVFLNNIKNIDARIAELEKHAIIKPRVFEKEAANDAFAAAA